ncbi:MAG: RNA polymerase sigma factor [Planctomycetota bacterium]
MESENDPFVPSAEPAAHDLNQTALFIQKARAGDRQAMNDLLNRYKKPLERFLHSRLSPVVHRYQDTQDGTQDILIAAYESIVSGRFEYRGIGSFWYYLRTSARNYIIKKNQRAAERGVVAISDESALAPEARQPSPIAKMIGQEQLIRYERALEAIPEDHRNAFLLFHEVGLSHAQIAEECKFPSADAARMCVSRAKTKLLSEMTRGEA